MQCLKKGKLVENNKERKNWIEKYGLLIMEIIKIIPIAILCILSVQIYKYIQTPESSLNKRKTENEVAREQSKMLIELLKEQDVTKLKYACKIINLSYHDMKSPFLDSLDSFFNPIIFNKEKDDLMNKYLDLLTKRIDLTTKFNNSYDGIDSFEIGKSKIAPDISYLLNYIDKQISDTEKLLIGYKVDLKTLKYYKEFNNFMKE